jgi:hypothetical protein
MGRRIHLRESVKGPLKDKDSRMVPVLDALAPILASWKLRAGNEDRVIPPMRCDGEKIDKHTPGIYLRAALRQLVSKHSEGQENGQSRPVSRVLSPRLVALAGEADIPLGPALPRASSELTRERGGPPLSF